MFRLARRAVAGQEFFTRPVLVVDYRTGLVLNAPYQPINGDGEVLMASADFWLREIANHGSEGAENAVARIEQLEESLHWIADFADVRSQDDSKTFARVNRGALRTIRDRARAQALGDPVPA